MSADKGKTNFISVVIITKNEEKNIDACLRSIQGLADDIVVLDSWSTDRTEEICKSFGARFFQADWQGYARTKNRANEMAMYDWILSLDADEILSNELHEKLSLLKAQNSLTTCSFNRLTNYCGRWIKHGGWYPDVKIRLFNRKNALWQGDFVHETLVLQPNTTITHLNENILHYTFHTIEEHVAQVNKYSTLSAEEKFKKRKRSGLIKLLFSPLFTFLQMYIFKLGFLDGMQGFFIAVISAYARFLRYAKLWMMHTSK